jgi:predicted N-acetyltransferase YhbS
VEPGRLRAGVGRALLARAAAAARALGAERLQIQGDPHATGFYVACGARPVGELASGSIPGRMLPLFELSIDDDA